MVGPEGQLPVGPSFPLPDSLLLQERLNDFVHVGTSAQMTGFPENTAGLNGHTSEMHSMDTWPKPFGYPR